MGRNGQVSDFCSLTSGWSKGNSLSAARTSLGKSMGLTSVLSPRLKGKSLTSVTLSLWRGKCSLRRVFLQLGTRFSPPDSILSAARTSLCRPQGQVFVGLKDKPLSASRTSLCLPQVEVAQRMESGTYSSSTFLLPRWCRGGAENVVWDAFSFNFPQPRVAQRMSSGTRFSPTLFNPG